MNIEALSSSERDALLRKLLHHMPQDTRRKVMEEMPVVYVKMAPHTATTVLARVAEKIEEVTA